MRSQVQEACRERGRRRHRLVHSTTGRPVFGLVSLFLSTSTDRWSFALFLVTAPPPQSKNIWSFALSIVKAFHPTKATAIELRPIYSNSAPPTQPLHHTHPAHHHNTPPTTTLPHQSKSNFLRRGTVVKAIVRLGFQGKFSPLSYLHCLYIYPNPAIKRL